MKKTTLIFAAFSLLLAGCTSKEQDQQIESFWQQQIFSVMAKAMAKAPRMPAPTPVIPQADKEPLAPEQVQPASDKLQALLFLNPSCPWCQKLKKEGWIEQFRQKYPTQVELVEYDLSKQKHQEIFVQMLIKHNMRQVGTPVLFVGDQVISGYPFGNRVDEAVQKELAKQALKESAADSPKEPTSANKPAPVTKTRASKPQKPYMKIIMEEPAKVTNAKLSSKDRQLIQKELVLVQQSNQQTLQDIGAMFNDDVRSQAAMIIGQTEQLLKTKSNSSQDYKSYMAAQKLLLSSQEKKLNELMRKNANKIRSIRG